MAQRVQCKNLPPRVQLSDTDWSSQCPPPTPHPRPPATAGSAAAGTKGVPPYGTFVTGNWRLAPQGSTASPLPQLGKGMCPESGRARLPGSPDPHRRTSSPAPRYFTPGVRTPPPTLRVPPPASKPAEGLARSRAGNGSMQQSSPGPTWPRSPHDHQQHGSASKEAPAPQSVLPSPTPLSRPHPRTTASSPGLTQGPPRPHQAPRRPHRPGTGLGLAPGGVPTSSPLLPLTSLPSGRLPLFQGSSGYAAAPPRGRSNPRLLSMPLTPLHIARQHRRVTRLGGPRPTRLRSGLPAIQPRQASR
ncbi:hypothetical protein NDU88_010540 [Pleurodeles waltl]|uniref:Uncharacterized protein n=1 Tax=Pleurodeles waltl TaxID=8319 RepID=A0AAV7S3L1_PLEWA|nr:hypothetical protein NDU88_010540 [Pleurodeles waltl]